MFSTSSLSRIRRRAWIWVTTAAVLAVHSETTTAQQPSDSITAVEAYREFRSWGLQQPDALFERGDAAVEEEYRQYLAGRGLTGSQIETRLALLDGGAAELEVAMWNEVLTSDTPTFNTNPNGFLVRMMTGLPPGRALDVGMGQGRNAIWLAQHGWQVTGFDPADQAVALAERLAQQAGVELTTQVVGDEDFEWGTGQWDLVVLSYVRARPWIDTIHQALRPGGYVLLEGFHRDATQGASIGGAVVFDTNELLELFAPFRILHYEDAEGVSDFGRTSTRVVRLLATKE